MDHSRPSATSPSATLGAANATQAAEPPQPIQGISYFSTKGGTYPVRAASWPRGPVIVRSNFQYDLNKYIDNLRKQYSEICNGIFLGYDVRWYFDEYDWHFQGPKFLWTVLDEMRKQNEANVPIVANDWISANIDNPMFFRSEDALAKADINLLFPQQIHRKWGAPFLEYVRTYMIPLYNQAVIARTPKALHLGQPEIESAHSMNPSGIDMAVAPIQTSTIPELKESSPQRVVVVLPTVAQKTATPAQSPVQDEAKVDRYLQQLEHSTAGRELQHSTAPQQLEHSTADQDATERHELPDPPSGSRKNVSSPTHEFQRHAPLQHDNQHDFAHKRAQIPFALRQLETGWHSDVVYSPDTQTFYHRVPHPMHEFHDRAPPSFHNMPGAYHHHVPFSPPYEHQHGMVRNYGTQPVVAYYVPSMNGPLLINAGLSQMTPFAVQGHERSYSQQQINHMIPATQSMRQPLAPEDNQVGRGPIDNRNSRKYPNRGGSRWNNSTDSRRGRGYSTSSGDRLETQSPGLKLAKPLEHRQAHATMAARIRADSLVPWHSEKQDHNVMPRNVSRFEHQTRPINALEAALGTEKNNQQQLRAQQSERASVDKRSRADSINSNYSARADSYAHDMYGFSIRPPDGPHGLREDYMGDFVNDVDCLYIVKAGNILPDTISQAISDVAHVKRVTRNPNGNGVFVNFFNCEDARTVFQRGSLRINGQTLKFSIPHRFLKQRDSRGPERTRSYDSTANPPTTDTYKPLSQSQSNSTWSASEESSFSTPRSIPSALQTPITSRERTTYSPQDERSDVDNGSVRTKSISEIPPLESIDEVIEPGGPRSPDKSEAPASPVGSVAESVKSAKTVIYLQNQVQDDADANSQRLNESSSSRYAATDGNLEEEHRPEPGASTLSGIVATETPREFVPMFVFGEKSAGSLSGQSEGTHRDGIQPVVVSMTTTGEKHSNLEQLSRIQEAESVAGAVSHPAVESQIKPSITEESSSIPDSQAARGSRAYHKASRQENKPRQKRTRSQASCPSTECSPSEKSIPAGTKSDVRGRGLQQDRVPAGKAPASSGPSRIEDIAQPNVSPKKVPSLEVATTAHTLFSQWPTSPPDLHSPSIASAQTPEGIGSPAAPIPEPAAFPKRKRSPSPKPDVFIDWKKDYELLQDSIMEVPFPEKSRYTQEGEKLKDQLSGIEARIREGDYKSSNGSKSVKKNWPKKRAKHLEEYKSLIDELALLHGRALRSVALAATTATARPRRASSASPIQIIFFGRESTNEDVSGSAKDEENMEEDVTSTEDGESNATAGDVNLTDDMQDITGNKSGMEEEDRTDNDDKPLIDGSQPVDEQTVIEYSIKQEDIIQDEYSVGYMSPHSRRQACEALMRPDRPEGKQTYAGVVALRDGDDAPLRRGPGNDWAVGKEGEWGRHGFSKE